MKPKKGLLTGYIVLLGAQLAIGSAAIMARYGLEGGANALSLSAWRLTLSAVALWVIGVARHNATASVVPMDRATRARLVAAGACLGLHFVTWFASLRYIPVGRSTLLVTTSPVYAGLLGYVFMRQRLTPRFWGGLAIGAIGLAFINQRVTSQVFVAAAPPSMLAPITATQWGDLLAILGAVCIAVYLLLAQAAQLRVSTWRIVSCTFTSAAVTVWVMMAVSGALPSAFPCTVMAWASVVGMALVPQLMGHGALNWSLKRFPAGVVAAATLLEPIIAAAIAWWLFAEAISPVQMFGAMILLVGVGLSLTKPNA